MDKLSLSTAERIAIQFRAKEIECSLTEPINAKNILRKLNILAVYRPLSDNFFGLSLKSEKNLFILINSNTSRGRQHYTIAHELYHLFFDDKTFSHICSTETDKSMIERNANMFASALLLPEAGILQYISAPEIKSKQIELKTILRLEQFYSVSRSALLVRLKALHLLSEESYSLLYNLSPTETAKQYGYDTVLYSIGNHNLVIGDFGEKARTLFDKNIISEGHYRELMNLLLLNDNEKD
jgi:Zn-dependent peptidase ImmA (M78 family)